MYPTRYSSTPRPASPPEPLRGITICVGEAYAALLAITLPRNMRHLAECLVVSSPADHATADVVRQVPGARLLATDAFTRHGARFNKGLAMEEGFDALGRHGMLLIWDADILLPERLDLARLAPGMLHGATRRILEDPSKWTPELNWRTCRRSIDGGPIGFFQCFSAADPAIAAKRPWYDVSFTHAGGSDAYFMTHWPASHKRVLPIEVLHLGPRDRHWFGTDPESRRMMDAFVIRNGWQRAALGRDHAAAAKVGEIVERVEVPGYAPSDFELPFVRRTKLQDPGRRRMPCTRDAEPISSC